MEILVAAVAVCVAAASMVFAGLQARSTRLQAQSVLEQTSLMQASSELSFNLEVMVRLQEVLLRVADDPQTHQLVWHQDGDENRRPQIASQSILDVLSMALKAVDRLPGFSTNGEDWTSYTRYVLQRSPSLRAEVLKHPEWWPEITPYAHETHTAEDGAGADD
ncbi:hypothetical protein [Paractinoplanes rishiriensis]|uniref:Uncharacterized protein n=1 Tax=Paractinoplanes rishiriensis TaxID=1050105 RepID=A0A919K441_9ACTN|nr:hypothetical protein [Actinoplanes rishiriensis]GIF00547.1 hypothetical protein Ari01nite_80110 [Actinoplanes rishiriensis]